MSEQITAHTRQPVSNGPLPIPYTAEEVGRTFADLLETLDYATELYELGVGKLRIFKRARVKSHLTAVSIALWNIALGKSFPNDADAFFTHFTSTYPPLTGDAKNAKQLLELVIHYDSLAKERKDADFTCLADAIVEAIGTQGKDERSQQLRLSLHIRGLYGLIFEKLI